MRYVHKFGLVWACWDQWIGSSHHWGTSPLYSVRGRLTCLSDPGDKIWQGEKIPYKPINHGNREYANFNNVLYSSKLARE